MKHPSEWLIAKKEGLYCKPGNFYIDPKLPVDFALITHAHLDHAISGHQHVLATAQTLSILKIRYGAGYAAHSQPLPYFEQINHNGVTVSLLPAGHILGSAQVVLEHGKKRVVISGDYKRSPDPTCLPFEPCECDIFITEATFGLPIFKHPPAEQEIQKLLQSINENPESCHVIGLYSLGKCQRVIAELRRHHYDDVIYMQPSKLKICELYEEHGIDMGKLALISSVSHYPDLRGKLILVSPSAIHGKWLLKFPSPIIGLATGWMRVRARAKQQGVELPLIISDHADWYELTNTIEEINPSELWVTHGQEDAIVYYAQRKGYIARALDIWRDEMEA